MSARHKGVESLRYRLKICPRCRRGNLLERRDQMGYRFDCVHCGYVLNASEKAFLIEATYGQLS